ncbi:hypothetical protein FCL47_07845 [Desulfopila sp. IMCC35006]|uniref:hypothetical protein n=1 Tax=Desulfopila sp. IMCC35006 TaxID=2569542 RepID=UPI0010ACB862|nr:hypothetical protein [Desulfopila sp. IMCC35006]TKB27082.1 hypothetical protein FCL47_07845 [Desulfopila sp. IMCC35006]
MFGTLTIMNAQQPILFRQARTVILAVVLLFLSTSCTALQRKNFPVPVDHHPHALAEQLFLNGDFENALLQYEQIYETALSPEDKNHALYGLASTQMMLARNANQLIEAISNLQKWDAGKGTAPFTENRHLLILALKQQSTLIEEKSKTFTEHENLQNSVIANQQLKITQMTTANEQLQLEIKKLRKQIEEIEAIDENVQSKRKSL